VGLLKSRSYYSGFSREPEPILNNRSKKTTDDYAQRKRGYRGGGRRRKLQVIFHFTQKQESWIVLGKKRGRGGKKGNKLDHQKLESNCQMMESWEKPEIQH